MTFQRFLNDCEVAVILCTPIMGIPVLHPDARAVGCERCGVLVSAHVMSLQTKRQWPNTTAIMCDSCGLYHAAVMNNGVIPVSPLEVLIQSRTS